jgi:hypothetical protein
MTAIHTGDSDVSLLTTPIPPLDPLYINERRVAQFVGAEHLADALARVSSWNAKQTAHFRSVRCAELLRDWLQVAATDIKPLHRGYLTATLVPGRLFTYEGYLWCKNVRGRRNKQASTAYVNVEQLSPTGESVRLGLQLHPDHVVVGSPGELLQGKVANLFVLAQVMSIDEYRVDAVPVFIGYLREQGIFEPMLRVSRNELFVDGIDNFKAVEQVPSPSTKEIGILRDIPEEDVKVAFAEIIGEPDIPKDWGGETSDLVTTQLRIDGQRTSAAFMFKGPAGGKKFRQMEISDLGKRGDQIERLTTEPVDVLVVQHCHKVGSAVRNTVRAFCNQTGRERRYCVISGYDTYRVLKAYGKCGL